MRRSLTDRYDRIEARAAELAGHPLPGKTPASAVHIQTVKVLSELLAMGQRFSTNAVPAPLRAMMRALNKMEPVLIDELSTVPAEAIIEFLADLAGQIQTIIDTPLEETRGHDVTAAQPAVAGPDLATTA